MATSLVRARFVSMRLNRLTLLVFGFPDIIVMMLAPATVFHFAVPMTSYPVPGSMST